MGSDTLPTLYNPWKLGRDRRLIREPSAPPVIRPRAIHRHIIALALSGYSVQEIADMVGRHYTFVQQTLKSPEVRRVINDILEDVDQELANLAPLAVDALRGLLRSGSEGVKMQAAKLVLESQGKAKAPDGAQGKTAEDLVQSIMAQIEVEGKAVVRIGAASRSSPAALAAGDPDQIDENAGG